MKKKDPASQPSAAMIAATTDWRRAQRFLRFIVVGFLIAVLILATFYSLLVPLIISSLLTYLLLPVTNRLERRGWARAGSSALIVAFFLGLLAIAIVRLVPVLFSQGQLLLHLIPSAVQSMVEHWSPLIDKTISEFGIKTPKTLKQYLSEYSVFGGDDAPFQQSLSGIWITGATLLGGIVNVMLIPLITFFLLKDYPTLENGIRSLIPVDLRVPMRVVAKKIDQTLRSVIKGQVTVAGILTAMYVIGFSAVGLQSAVVIGVVAGICRIVPYLDVIVGGTLSTVVLLSDFPGWGRVFGVFIVFMIVQGLDGALITPRVIGERVGLHPVVVILSVLAFGHWFGFWGVLLAIPIVAVCKALLAAALPYYQASKLYLPAVSDTASGGNEKSASEK